MTSFSTIRETFPRKVSWVFLSAVVPLLAVGWIAAPAVAGNSVVFHDDFEAGLDPTVWNQEVVNGAIWAHATEGGNGFIRCSAQYPYNWGNRFTDIVTQRDDFGDFIMTWDMRFHTKSWHKDHRPAYFRVGESSLYPGFWCGYWIHIGVWIPTIPDHYLNLYRFNCNLSQDFFTPTHVSYPWELYQWYSFRLEAFGNSFKLKVWKKGDAEPADWTMDVVDSGVPYASGSIGFGNYWGSITDVDNVLLIPAIQATVDADPNTLNLKSEGNYATAYIELPEGFDPGDIDLSTASVGDYDGDGVPDMMVKFNRAGVISLLSGSGGSSLWLSERGEDVAPLDHGDEFEVTVSGYLADGRMFSGTDVIRVIDPGGGSDDAAVLSVRPSPLNRTASISYEVLHEGHVSLRVYDAAGRLVCTLVSDSRGAGRHETTWDRTADDGRPVAAGVYFLRLEQRGQAWVEKTLVVD
jgi:hypothetical protein